MKTKVVTYQSPAGALIDLTAAQITKLEASGKWPKDHTGQEYCSVHHGQHYGSPTYSDAQLAAEVGIESI